MNLKLFKQWKHTKNECFIYKTLGTKFHYYKHIDEFIDIWQFPIGYIHEQSVESYHKIYNQLRRRYLNQRGKLRVKFSIEQLFLITSPLYQQ